MSPTTCQGALRERGLGILDQDRSTDGLGGKIDGKMERWMIGKIKGGKMDEWKDERWKDG